MKSFAHLKNGIVFEILAVPDKRLIQESTEVEVLENEGDAEGVGRVARLETNVESIEVANTVSDMYTPDFVATLVDITDLAKKPQAGWKYENGEFLAPTDAADPEIARQAILAQILALEQAHQPRAVRETALGISGGLERLQDIENQIAGLRAQL